MIKKSLELISFLLWATIAACSADPGQVAKPDGAMPGRDAGADSTLDDKANPVADMTPNPPQNVSPFGVHPASDNKYSYAKDLNIVWSREGTYLSWVWVDPLRDGHFSFIHAIAPPPPDRPDGGGAINYDLQWLGTPDAVNLVVNICPFRKGGEFASPEEETIYQQFVARTVERYDGDGDLGCVEQAPDCYVVGDGEHPSQEVIARFAANPIKFWQVCNQVTDACEGPDCPATHSAKYARVQELTYKGVKAADDSAAVLIAGDSAREMYPAVFMALKGGYVDIIDFHRFGQEGIYDPQRDFDFLKERLAEAGFDVDRLRFWITETGTYSGDPVDDVGSGKDPPYQSEAQQARGLFKIYTSALAYGIERVFWAWSILEGFSCDCCIFDYTGIVYDGNQGDNSNGCENNDPHDKGRGVKKLAYYTYKLMVERLSGSDWGKIETIQKSDGVFVYKFTRSGAPIWVAWSESEISFLLTGITPGQVEITEAVPRVESGAEVDDADYAGSFATEVKSVAGETVELVLGPTPVMITEK